MKKIYLLILSMILIMTLASCKTIYRDYQEDELETMARTHFAIDSYVTFKIIDSDTARYLTSKLYQNSGIIIGIKDNEYIMIFVPRKISENPYILENTPYFDLEEIYDELDNIIEESIFLEDYGGLSISVEPYMDILEANPTLNLENQIFFMVTTDEDVYYAHYIQETLYIFNTDYDLIIS